MEGITGAFLDQGEYKLGFEVLGPELTIREKAVFRVPKSHLGYL